MSVEGYYYLISSLPMLRFGDRPPMDSATFLAGAREHLDAGRMARLEAVSLVPDAVDLGEGVAAEWRAWETYVRNILVRHRAKSPEAVHHWHRPEADVFPGIRRQVEEAVEYDNPLQREHALDELRWRMLDGLRPTHEFDFEALVLYRLQLLLAEKWSGRDSVAGMDSLNRLVDKLEEEAVSHRTVSE